MENHFNFISIPHCYYSENLIKFIDYLIEVGYSSYDDLPKILKNEVSSKCIECLDDDSYTCILDDTSFMKDFKKFVEISDFESLIEMGNKMRDSAVKHFQSTMNDLFYKRIIDTNESKMISKGLFPVVIDEDSGEIEWRRVA